MKLKLTLFLLILLQTIVNLRAQKKDLVEFYDVNLTGGPTIYELPVEGSFVTIQLCAYKHYHFYDDYRFMAILRWFNPLFFRTDSTWETVSLGIFNSKDAANKCLNHVKCIYTKPFLVAYQDGQRIPIDNFFEGTQKERKPNINKTIKELHEAVYQGHYRVQFGYYEEEGFEPEEQEVYDSLAAHGVEVITERYLNGRLCLSKNTYSSYTDAERAKEEMEKYTGDYWTSFGLKAYEKVEEGMQSYWASLYECLIATKD